MDVVEDVIEEVSPSESPLLPIEDIMGNSIDTIKEEKNKEFKEYVHVISKRETLITPESNVLVSTKVQKFLRYLK